MKKYTGILICLLVLISCTFNYYQGARKNYTDVNTMLRNYRSDYKFLKAHLKNGDVVIFNTEWKLSDDLSTLSGQSAERYNALRTFKASGNIKVSVADISLLETNQPLENQDDKFFVTLGLLTVGNVLVTAYCISNPKACWGSCPTFYYDTDDNLLYSRAEGFSSSIAPCLEKGDMDALNNPKLKSRDFKLIMKNEAFETHVVNCVQLYAIPRPIGKRAFHDTDGRFYLCDLPLPPRDAIGPEGNILQEVNAMDENERSGLTDENDLNSKESLDLIFRTDDKEHSKGLVLNFRQSLLPTFLFYSALSYMGDEMSDMLAEVERRPMLKNKLESCFDILGGIEIMVWDDRSAGWKKIQTLFEAGPIARNLQLVPLPGSCSTQKEIKVRLRMSKGLWRLDYAGITNIHKEVQPLILNAVSLEKNGIPDNRQLPKLSKDDGKYLVSMPGDRFIMGFQLPDTCEDYELLINSKGYYLEWMRKEWLGGKDIVKLRKMVMGDKKTWHDLAREFKPLESSMEQVFWNSRVNQ